MNTRSRSIIYYFVSVAVVIAYLTTAVSARADGVTPPAPTDAPVVPVATDVPAATEVPVTTDAPVATDVPAATQVPTATDAPAQDISVPEAQNQLPAGTDVVVLDQNGESLPLASADAADVLAVPDPYFTVGGTTYHFTTLDCDPITAGNQGCTNPIQASVDFLNGTAASSPWVGVGATPDDGNIYVEATILTEFQGAVTVDGSIWTTTPVSLGIVGAGVTGGGSPVTSFKDGSFTILNMNDFTLSGFRTYHNSSGGFVHADGNNGTFTLKDMWVYGTGSTGIYIGNQKGDVNLTGVYAGYSKYDGAIIQTLAGGNVTVKDSSFLFNGDNGLVITTQDNSGAVKSGDVSLINVTSANNNGNFNGSDGANITTAGGSVAINDSSFYSNIGNGNNNDGLEVNANSGGPSATSGSVTLLSVTARDNSEDGAKLNSGASINVQSSQFYRNGLLGAELTSGSSVNVQSSIFHDNSWGVVLSCSGGICLTEGAGLAASSSQITLNNVNADKNYGYGAALFGENFYVTNSTFNNNGLAAASLTPGDELHADGLWIDPPSPSSVTINCSQANNNPAYGFEVDGGNVSLHVSASGNGWANTNVAGRLNEFRGCGDDGSGQKKVTSGGVCNGLESNATFITPKGDFAVFPCPIKDRAYVQPLDKDKLPGNLEDGQKYLSSLVTSVIRRNQPLDVLDAAGLVSFLIPEGMEKTTLTILFWDGTKWSDLGGAVSVDGKYFEISTKSLGTFVLVSK
jgi:hypothetical protein